VGVVSTTTHQRGFLDEERNEQDVEPAHACGGKERGTACVCVCVHMYVCVFVCVLNQPMHAEARKGVLHVCMCAHVCICIEGATARKGPRKGCLFVHAYIYACVTLQSTRVSATYVCMHVCMYVLECVYICTHMLYTYVRSVFEYYAHAKNESVSDLHMLD
jgi:hypothetical protein